MNSQSDLATKYNADKGESGHNYIPMYEHWLKNRTVNVLLEIGFGSGASARMWREYYPNADIYVVELFSTEFRETWHNPNTLIDGVNIIAGDATDARTWRDVTNQVDVLIDDGSHNPHDQISTLNLALDKVKSKGLYIIEDIYCNFEGEYLHDDVIFPWLNKLMIAQQNPNSRYLSKDFYFNQQFMSYPSSAIYAYHLYKGAIVLEKS